MTGTPHTVKSRLTALRTSFWPVPAACAAGAILLAIGLSVLELRVGLPFGNVLPSGLAGARSLLSSIITAMISFTALVFSITVVALQLASSQYSPRVLRTFLQDRVTQFALGTFLATALFAMVVLAALPDLSSARLPELSLAVAMILVLVSSGLFLYYLHHITSIMRVSHIVAAIGAQTRRSIDEHVPRTSAQETTVRLPPPVSVVTAPGPGLVDDIDLGSLARLARAHACAFSVLPTPGDFVVAGQPLVTVHATEAAPPPPVPEARVRAAVTLAVERQAGQDVGFGFRQLADIAERALSPVSTTPRPQYEPSRRRTTCCVVSPHGSSIHGSYATTTARSGSMRHRRASTASSRSRSTTYAGPAATNPVSPGCWTPCSQICEPWRCRSTCRTSSAA